jgi:hypothetical protein
MDKRNKYDTTVSVIARVDMQDEMQNFVSRKSWPSVRLRLGDGSMEHRFSRHGEEHRFTVNACLTGGEHDVVLEFTEKDVHQGAVEILSLTVQGCPIGPPIYQCRYTTYEKGETLHSHLYLGIPGEWRWTLQVPVQVWRPEVGIQ